MTTDALYFSPENTPVDYVKFAGAQTPGYAEVKGLHAPRKIQAQAGPGLSGARYMFMGLEVVEFHVILHLQDDDDWRDWEVYKRVGAAGAALRNPIGEGSGQAFVQLRPVTFWHPFAADPTIMIDAVLIKDVTQPDREGEGTVWSVDITCLGYRALKVQSAPYSKPEGPKPDERDQRNLNQEQARNAAQQQLAALRNSPPPAPK